MKSNSDVAPEVFDDPKAAARVRKRRRARSRIVRLLGAGAVGAVLLGLTALLKISHADYSAVRDEVASREAQLRTLQTQQRSGHRRLAALQHEKGRAQSLIEHGYVRPGDRILLFPSTPPSATSQVIQGSQTQNGQSERNAASETGHAQDADTARDADSANALPTETSPADPSLPASDSPATATADSSQASGASAASGVASRATPDAAVAPQMTTSASAPRDAVPSGAALRSSPKSSPQLQPQSAWRRAGQTLQGWWQALRGAGAAPQSSQN